MPKGYHLDIWVVLPDDSPADVQVIGDKIADHAESMLVDTGVALEVSFLDFEPAEDVDTEQYEEDEDDNAP